MKKIRVMLVDDHAVVRLGYGMLLSQSEDISVVHESSRGEEACHAYQQVRPDVVVMDINLPGIGGLASIRRIRARDPEAKILAFSIHDEKLYVQRALEAGARGYVTKSCAPELLVDAVRKVALGETYVGPDIAGRAPARTEGDTEADLDSLTAREFDIFCLLAEGFTTREIADKLCLGYKTVANYTTTLKSKLNVNTVSEMTRMAYQHGIMKN